MLGLTFKLRDYLPLRYTFLVISIGLLGYKLWLRIRKSYMFNRIVYNCSIIGETFLLHMLLTILPAQIFLKDNYFIFILIDLIATMLLLVYVHSRYRLTWILTSIDDFTHESEKLIGYLQILDFYSCNTNSTQKYIS